MSAFVKLHVCHSNVWGRGILTVIIQALKPEKELFQVTTDGL